ncbi:MAG: molecular chaperone [Novosphingobium sp.]
MIKISPMWATPILARVPGRKSCATLLAAMASLLWMPVSASAQGDLLVAPTRIVMNGGGSAEVVLNNIGATPATYRISLELRRMLADGSLEPIDQADYTPEQNAMLEMVRYAPRRIQLPPNQPQSVRISARPPEGFGDGEYRVHMTFRAVPEAPAVEAPRDPAAASGFTLKLTPIYGVTIPVIVRKGQLAGEASILGAALVRDGNEPAIRIDLARTGNRSVYGELRIVAPGAKQPAFLVRGIAIYPELAQRSLQMGLTPAQVAALKGPMVVEYREMPEQGGRLMASRPVTF